MPGKVVNPKPFFSENQYYQEKIIPTGTIGTTTTKISPGKGFKIKILSARLYLDTDATVANRYIVFKYLNTGILTMRKLTSSVIVADKLGLLTQGIYADGSGALPDEATLDVNDWGIIEHPILYENQKLEISITAGVAGDLQSGVVSYLKVPVTMRFPD